MTPRSRRLRVRSERYLPLLLVVAGCQPAGDQMAAADVQEGEERVFATQTQAPTPDYKALLAEAPLADSGWVRREPTSAPPADAKAIGQAWVDRLDQRKALNGYGLSGKGPDGPVSLIDVGMPESEFEAWATPFSRPVFERAGFALAGVVSEPYQGVEFERYRMATAPARDVPARLSHKAEGRAAPGRGEGLFAREAIACGEPIVEWTGRALSLAQWQRVPQRIRENSVQIGDDAYLVPDVLVAGDHVNHSCEPNAGLRGDRTIVAMRDIAAGEEITYDYAMSDGSPYDEFVCCCGAPACRGNVTGDDWRRPELQERYRGWFSPYLAARIRRGG